MKLVHLYLEAFILLLGAWTVAYTMATYAHLGFAELRWMFPLLAVLALLLALREWRAVLANADNGERRQAAAWVALGGVLATAVLILNRPDHDDVGYLSGPLQDSLTPHEPLSFESWHIPFSGGKVRVDILSNGEAYDPLAIVLADLFGGHPMSWYHNILPVFLTLAWVAVYLLLLEKLEVRGWRQWWALAGIIGLLALEGTTHRSLGNFWLLRIWQGKIMMMSVLLPALILYAWRAQETLRRRDLFLALLLVTSGPFINRSALFLFPAALITFTVAYQISFRVLSPPPTYAAPLPLRNGAMVMLPLLIMLTVAAGATYLSLQETRLGPTMTMSPVELPATEPPATESSATELPAATVAKRSALESLSSSFQPTFWSVTRDLVVLLLVPLLALSGPARFIIPIMSLLVALFFFIPPWSNLIHEMLTEPAYWRVYYVLPLPLAFGLVPLIFTRSNLCRGRGAGRLAAGLAVLIVLALAFERTVLSRQNRVELKWPWELRFRDHEREPLASFHPYIAGKAVLATNWPSHVLQTLYYRDVRVAFDRAYPNVRGMAMDAHNQLEGCKVTEAGIRAIDYYVLGGADALIARRCPQEAWAQLASQLPGLGLERVESAGAYDLYLVEGSPRLEELRRRWKARHDKLLKLNERLEQGGLSAIDMAEMLRLIEEPVRSAQ